MLAVLIAGLAFYWHGVHMSTATIDYRADRKQLEMMLTMSADHLEQILSTRSGLQIEIDRSPQVGSLAEAYIRERWELRGPDGKTIAWRWVGLDVKGGNVNCFLEAKVSSDGGLQLRNEILIDWQRDQINRVLPKRDGKVRPPQLLFWSGTTKQFQNLLF
jgi:hypothetical protein